MCLAASLLTMLTGCAGGPNREPGCSRSESARSAHAAALVVDGGAQSQATGRTLIALIDAACGD